MKKTRIAAFMATSMVCGAALVACDKNNSTPDTPVTPTATSAAAKTSVYFAPAMLDMFDLKCDIAGEEVVLSMSNTTETVVNNHTMRLYQAEANYTEFPVKKQATATCTLKDGIDLATAEPSDYCLYLEVKVSNDNKNTWSAINVDSDMFLYSGDVDWSEVDADPEFKEEFTNARVVADIEFAAADKVSVSISR